MCVTGHLIAVYAVIPKIVEAYPLIIGIIVPEKSRSINRAVVYRCKFGADSINILLICCHFVNNTAAIARDGLVQSIWTTGPAIAIIYRVEGAAVCSRKKFSIAKSNTIHLSIIWKVAVEKRPVIAIVCGEIEKLEIGHCTNNIVRPNNGLDEGA